MLKRFLLIVFLILFLVVSNISAVNVQAQTADFLPLTEPGPYGVKLNMMTFVDKSRTDWNLKIGIWYPADKTKGKPVMPGSLIRKDTSPDKSGAPYPLIIYSHGWTGNLGELMDTKAQLASQGYVIVAATHHDTDPSMREVVDRPLDILFILNELAAITDGDLSGMIDTNNVGLMGWSLGGQTSLQMLGLVSDPVNYTNWCKEHPKTTTVDCRVMNLEKAEAYRSQLGLKTLSDGRWEPFTDKRIRAVLAMAPGGFTLTTEDMLAAVSTPTMILHGNKDDTTDYQGNAIRTYRYLGTKDRYLITIIDGVHAVFGDPKLSEHFATAFFGYYLKADNSYLPYLTPEHLPAWPYLKLAWGAYEGK